MALSFETVPESSKEPSSLGCFTAYATVPVNARKSALLRLANKRRWFPVNSNGTVVALFFTFHLDVPA